MLERATRFEPSVVEGRVMIHVKKNDRQWIVIVEPDATPRSWSSSLHMRPPND
jgi:hypothetical protein